MIKLGVRLNIKQLGYPLVLFLCLRQGKYCLLFSV